jgi:ABC-type multidrug transport system fused ATPase/permease subunit
MLCTSAVLVCAAAEGQVLVDGTELTLLDAEWYRSKLGVVSQEPRLFSMSVRDNIAYGA